MRKKLLLVDGSGLLITAFHSSVPLEYSRAKTEEDRLKALEDVPKTTNGQYINGAYIAIKKIMSYIERGFTDIVVCWDLKRAETFRKEIYSEYKANRKETALEIKEQFGITQDVLRGMGVPQFSVKGYEADDIIGTLAEIFKETHDSIILSKDQDFIQLVNEHTKMWIQTKKAEDMKLALSTNQEDIPLGIYCHTPESVKYFYGIQPKQMIDFKAITGDTADNIPGIKGLGKVAVTTLLANFNEIEDIFNFIEDENEAIACLKLKEMGVKRANHVYQLLKDGKDIAILCKKLATIVKDVPLNLTKKDIQVNYDSKGKDFMFEKYEFDILQEQMKDKFSNPSLEDELNKLLG